VDFYADWCGPCKAIGPIVEELANEYHGKIQVRKVNIDDNPELASQLGIRGIPTLILFKDGKPAETVVGLVSKSALADVIDRHAA
jgi:thioredoxin 1